MPPGLQGVLDRALAKEPAARFASAGALAQAARAALAAPGAPPAVPPPATDATTTVEPGSPPSRPVPPTHWTAPPPPPTYTPPPASPQAGVPPAPVAVPPRQHQSRLPFLLGGFAAVLVLLALAGYATIGRVGSGRGASAVGTAVPAVAAAATTVTAVTIAATGTSLPPTPTATPSPASTATSIPTATLAPTGTANLAPTQTRAAELAIIATLAAPTATAPAPPTATSTPPASPTPTATPRSPTATATPLPQRPTGGTPRFDNFSPYQLAGAFRREDGMLYGRQEVAIYGVGGDYSTGTIPFTVDAPPSGRVTLLLTGLDDERDAHTAIQVMVNGTVVFSGPSALPNVPPGDTGIGGADRYWGQMAITIPASAFRVGANTLAIRNTEAWAGYRGPPWILINRLEFAASSGKRRPQGPRGDTFARKAHGVGMRVVATRGQSAAPLAHIDRLLPTAELPALLAEADHVAFCLPLAVEMRGIIGAREVGQMRRSGYLDNTGRGALVDNAHCLTRRWN